MTGREAERLRDGAAEGAGEAEEVREEELR